MYGFMAIAYFAIFQAGFGVTLEVDTVEYWFMMQIAMLCGFMTAYPVNWWLIRAGIKEKM
jgi:ABC-type amino acid transport system permease subunit